MYSDDLIEFINDNRIAVVLTLVLLGVIGYEMYLLFKQKNTLDVVQIPVHIVPEPEPEVQVQEPAQTEGFEGYERFEAGNEAENVNIIVFFAPWCPHCKSFMDGQDSIWNQLKRKNANRSNRRFIDVNCDKQPDVGAKYGVKHFPTIVKEVNGQAVHFEGERSVSALEQFIGGAPIPIRMK